jgi:hypothetical protein
MISYNNLAYIASLRDGWAAESAWIAKTDALSECNKSNANEKSSNAGSLNAA